MNDYEAHLSSYDHSHKQRLRDMKAMSRDPNAAERARRAEAKADGLVSIKLGVKEGASGPSGASGASTGGGGGFKKAGFKKAGFKNAFAPADSVQPPAKNEGELPNPEPRIIRDPLAGNGEEESDTEDEGYEVYDPRYPTD